jgi:two-component system, sensor histidine kinase
MTARHYLFIFFLCFLCPKLHSQSTKNGAIAIYEYASNDSSKLNTLTNWQLYYGRHLLASEMNRVPEKEKHFVYNPHSWAGQTINGKKLPAFGIATYYLKIRNTGAPIRHPIIYGLYVGCIESAYKLFINNRLIGEGGKAGKDRESYRPYSLPHPYYFSIDADSIDVVLQVSNFILPRVGGFTQDVYFGKPEVIKQLTLNKIMITCFILCLFVLVFIQQITLSILNKLEKSHIILSLLCVLFFLELLADSNLLAIAHLMSDYNIKLYYQIWTLSLLSVPLILRLIKISFPNEVPSRIEKAIYLLYALFTLVVLASGIEYVTEAGYIFIYISSTCIVYFNIILIKAIAAKRRYAIVHTISLVILVSFFIYDFIHAAGAHSQGYYTLAGMSIYILIQSCAFSFKLTVSNKQNIKQSKRLQQTNSALESTIEQRTKELVIANIELSRSNKQKFFFISTISHDLMNSFNVLLSFPRILYQDDSLPDHYRNNMEMIYKAAENGYIILENMLEWIKLDIIPKDELQPIQNLSSIVRQSIDLQAHYIQRKSIRIETEINDTLHFCCQKEQLNAILRNLISNAVKFSHQGGTIWIKNRIKSGWVQILIMDKGIGISPEMNKILFSQTNRKKRSGTQGEKGAGIGLLIIKDLIESNNGQISCYSKQGKTTVFIVGFKLSSDNVNETNINYR